jgi:hypothetical protein
MTIPYGKIANKGPGLKKGGSKNIKAAEWQPKGWAKLLKTARDRSWQESR